MTHLSLARSVLAAALCGAAGPGCGGDPASADVGDVATFKVARRDLRVSVSEKGTLKATNQLLVRPQIPGQAKIVSLVEEGTKVAEGDIVAELDATEVDKEVRDLRNRVIALNGDVTAAEAELAIQISENEADVSDTNLKKRFAEVELERFTKGEFVQEKTRREVRVQETESELERATRRYEQMPALLEEGFVTATQVEEERIAKVKAASELQLAKLDLETYLKYEAPKALEQREADVRNAGLEVDRAKQRCAARLAQKQSNVERQKSEMSNVQTRLATSETTLANMVIRAPGPGIVIYGDARNPWEDRQVRVGETVYAGQPFLTLPDLSDMQVIVAIHEADISRIKPGQKAFVVVETVRDAAVEGEVAKVAPVAASSGRRWMDDTKRFNVDVALKGDLADLKLKPGLTAKVEILVGELKNVVAVPVQAVFVERGRFFVFRRDGRKAERVPVEIEDGNAQFAVVTKGLEEGAEILLFNPESTEGGGATAAPAKESAPAGPPKRSNGKP